MIMVLSECISTQNTCLVFLYWMKLIMLRRWSYVLVHHGSKSHMSANTQFSY